MITVTLQLTFGLGRLRPSPFGFRPGSFNDPGSLLGTLQGIPDVPWKKDQVFVGVFFFFCFILF
jgi:hypothetical protein